MDQVPPTTRFAPSPTGLLHLGHAFSALFAQRRARAAGGRFLVRMEDIDAGRCRPDFERAILDDLKWLGVDWDGPVRRQSEHLEEYRAALARLDAQGLLYPCFCTRKEIEAEIARSGHAPHGPDGVLYPGSCRALDPAERAGRIAAGAPYAVTWDDAAQGVSLVTRGADLFAATHVHRLLQALLGLPVPDYRHHRLLADAQGRRYAKRDRALTLRALREAGHDPAEVRALAGWAG